MKFKIAHTNFNVMDMDKSVQFYKEALGLEEVRRLRLKTAASSWCLWVMESRAIKWNLHI